MVAKWQKRLRKAREAMGLSLAGAVKLLYEDQKIVMDRNNLRKFEIGKVDMPVSKFRALCKIYCVDSNWVLDLKE